MLLLLPGLLRLEDRPGLLTAELRTGLRLGAERTLLDRELLDLLPRDDDELLPPLRFDALPPRDFLASTGSDRTINANAAVTNTNPILL
jgi:hypothetical protein